MPELTRKLLLMLTVAVAAGSSEQAEARDPFGVAQRTVVELFVKPLRIHRAELVVTTEPFLAECSAHAITIRVVLRTKHAREEILKIDTVVVGDRLQFLSASGTAIHRGDHRPSNESIDRAMNFFSRINGWTSIDDDRPKPGTKTGAIERRMRDMHPRDYEANLKTIVFDELAGVPILVGTPPSPTDDNCP